MEFRPLLSHADRDASSAVARCPLSPAHDSAVATALTEPAVTRYGGGGFRLAGIARAGATIVCTPAGAAPAGGAPPATPALFHAAGPPTHGQICLTQPRPARA